MTPKTPFPLASKVTGLFALALAASYCQATHAVGKDPGYCWNTLSEGVKQKQSTLQPPSVASNGKHVWVAWHESQTIQVSAWDGKSWSSLPSLPPGPTGSYDAVIRANSAGDVYIAWRAVTCETDILVARWTGQAWQELGSPRAEDSKCGTYATNASMEMDEQGYPVVAWESGRKDARSVRIAKWTGTAWHQIGTKIPTSSKAYSLEVSLALDKNGRMLVAWVDGTEVNSYIRVANWNEAKWIDLGSTATGHLTRGQEARGPKLVALPNQAALLTWLDRGKKQSTLAFARWTGKEWQSVAALTSPSSSEMRPWLPSLALAKGATPLLAWSAETTGLTSSIYVRRLTAQGWQPVLDNIYLAKNASDVENATLAMGLNEDFNLLWSESGEDGSRIQVANVHPCAAGEVAVIPPKRRPRQDDWPRTVDEAVNLILIKLDDASKAQVKSTARADLVKFHRGWGMGIRNSYGLWGGNTDLLKSCGDDKVIHPESCSAVIIEHVWQKLQ